MYRGKSTKGRIYSFNSQAYELTRPLRCQIRIDELSFESTNKLDGKIAAGLRVDVNGSQTIKLADLGHLKSKSGRYVWNEETAKGKGMLPTTLTVNESDKIIVTITLNQKKGIPLLTRHERELHS